MFLVFSALFGEIQQRLGEKILKKGSSSSKGPEQNLKPSTSKVNDMHLIPMSPNKAVRKSGFQTHISSGLCKEKG